MDLYTKENFNESGVGKPYVQHWELSMDCVSAGLFKIIYSRIRLL